MSDFDKNTFTDFSKLVPGFDFLQNLTRQATAGAGSSQPKMPSFGHWVAPTMSVEELEKRITELKAVQFWLDQNATALKATIQALEVQKMTLATLHGMNVNMSEMAKAFSVKMPQSAASPAAAKAAEPSKGHHFSGLEVPETSYQHREPTPAAAESADEAPAGDTKDSHKPRAPGGVDPLQWWGALTHQFQSIAASALKEVAERHPKDAGKGMAEEAIKTATEFAESASQSFAKAANEARDFAAGKTKTKTKPKRKPAVKSAAKTRAKPAVKTAAKAPLKSPLKAKAKPRAKAPARAPAAVARKSPSRTR